MNVSPRNRSFPDAKDRDLSRSGEDTLRLIASLPAPEGLADRMQEGLRNASPTARVLHWNQPFRPSGNWMQSRMARGAAAAAIVCVVAGGGWQIYSRVQPAPAAKVLVMPPLVTQGGGLSPSNAKRVPDTLIGPVLTHPRADNTKQQVVDKTPGSTQPVSGRQPRPKKPTARSVVTPMP
jgi:hypothetical protein